MIVKASDTDYSYSGNLHIAYGVQSQQGDSEYIHVYSRGGDKVLEYSLNGSEYIEFENGDSGGVRPWSSGYTNNFELNQKVNTIIVREKESKNIFLRGLIIKNNDSFIILQEARAGHDKGDKIYMINSNDIDSEYSMDGGNNFSDVEYVLWRGNIAESEKLYEDTIIIRNKESKDVIYETPKIGQIEEEYIYENGKTTIKFNANGDAKDATSYTYTINEEKLSGNNIVIENDSNIKLEAYTNKEFIEQTVQKEIQAKVINVEKPSIELDDEDNLVLNNGNIINDELGNIYYSINDGEYMLYTEKISLQPGTHTIKAYQVTKEYEVKSLTETKEIKIEEKIEDNNQENEDNQNNDKENNNSEEIEKEENNEQTSNEKADKEQINDEYTYDEQKAEEEKSPKTGDNAFSYIIAIFVIILLNIVIKQKKRK